MYVINLTHYMKKFSGENYNTLLRSMKENLNKYRAIYEVH